MFTLHKGDITTAKVDAIVNAANPIMLGGGGVDGAIHRAAGPALRDACLKVTPVEGERCPVGEARITAAGTLFAKFVIHTVGPRYGIDARPEKLLASAYRTSLDLALDNQCQSIAFPAISCGAYGYPADEAARVALHVCRSGKYHEMAIHFYLFSDSLLEIWKVQLEKGDRA